MLALTIVSVVFPDFEIIKTQLKTPIIFDGRNQYNTSNLEEKGIEYYQIGK